MGVKVFGCGQCLPCRISKRREWTHRMMLESMLHEESTFVTLTYNDENLPHGGQLDPVHVQNWLKYLRKALYPQKVRFYLVGEYGDETMRPHYHVALFGVGKESEEAIKETWSHGFVQVGTLTCHSAQYIAGYVTKKMNKPGDCRLGIRYPEFARMSLRPGIGAHAMEDVARSLKTPGGKILLEENGDVPGVLSHGKKKLPLGRYLKRRLRHVLEFKELGTPEKALKVWTDELRRLFSEALSDPDNRSRPLKTIHVDLNKQKVLQFQGREKIRSQKRFL